MTKNKKAVFFIIMLFIAFAALFCGIGKFGGNNIKYPELETNGQIIYLPQYMPDGYTVDKVDIYDGLITSEFVNGSKHIVFIQILNDNVSIDVDTDDYQTSEANIGSKDGYLSGYGNDKIFTFFENDCMFSISGEIEKEEIDKIVKSIEPYKQ